MLTTLYVDDMRTPLETGYVQEAFNDEDAAENLKKYEDFIPKGTTVVRTVREAKLHIKEHGYPDVLDLDYYLANGTTGMDVLTWVLARSRKHPLPKNFKLLTHSSCRHANKEMRERFENFIKE